MENRKTYKLELTSVELGMIIGVLKIEGDKYRGSRSKNLTKDLIEFRNKCDENQE